MPRAWYSPSKAWALASLTRLSSFLLSHGFQQSSADHSLFLHFHNSDITAVLVYVDDIILAGNNLDTIAYITKLLDQAFSIKDLGTLKFFLGLEVAQTSHGIHLSQRKYVLDILSDSGMLASRPVSTPMNYSTRLTASMGTPLSETSASSYRRLIGRLIYLTNTRPDITHAVQQLSQYMAHPTSAHSQAAFRILRYLKGSPGSGIFLATHGTLQLKAFSDSDWAGCRDTQRSIIGFIYSVSSKFSWLFHHFASPCFQWAMLT